MNWLTADYVLLSAALIAGIIGLFIGFSGTLAFLAATVIGALAGKFAWIYSADFLAAGWSRGLASLVVGLLAFGLVRWIVKRVVNGLLHQPADALFGFITAAVTGFGLGVVAVYLLQLFGLLEIESVLVSEVLGLA